MSEWLGDVVTVRNVEVRPVVSRGNPAYPLVPDYDSYTEEGQRALRVNAVRQWLLHPRYSDPNYHLRPQEEMRATNPEAYTASLRFFDQYYLQGAYREGHSEFYDVEPVVRTPHLDRIAELIYTHHRTIVVIPRGFMKSTLMKKCSLMELLCTPNFKIHYITNTTPNAKAMMLGLFREAENNSLIIDDFAQEPEFRDRGEVKGGTRESTQPWSLDRGVAVFANNSEIRFAGIESQLRGARPHKLNLDDIERDAKSSTDMQSLRRDMHDLIWRQYAPMIRDPRRQMVWFGTLVSQQHLLAMATMEDPETGRLGDEAFRPFARVIFQAGYPSMNDLQHSLCEDYYPVAQMRREIEEATPDVRMKMRAEYFSKPGSSMVDGFTLDSELHGYSVRSQEGPPLGAWAEDPYLTEGVVSYWSAHDNKRQEWDPGEFLESLRIFITADWNLSMSSTADYSAIAVMGVNKLNELFVLDMFVDRLPTPELSNRIVDRIFRWRPRAVGVEAPTLHHSIAQDLHTKITDNMEAMPVRPQMVEISSYGQTKEEKIAGLQWRFGTRDYPASRIKLPLQWRSGKGWDHLFYQIENYDASVKGGGVRNDDAIDAVAMEQKMLPALRNSKDASVTRERDAIAQLLAGRTHDERGNPLASAIDPSSLPAVIVDEISRRAHQRNERNADQQRTRTRGGNRSL